MDNSLQVRSISSFHLSSYHPRFPTENSSLNNRSEGDIHFFSHIRITRLSIGPGVSVDIVFRHSNKFLNLFAKVFLGGEAAVKLNSPLSVRHSSI
jgi:hypothetical protein